MLKTIRNSIGKDRLNVKRRVLYLKSFYLQKDNNNNNNNNNK